MSLSERTVVGADRTVGLAGRLPGDRSRELEDVALFLIDGSEVRGMLHRARGIGILDFLNRQSEQFVAMTDVTVVHGADTARLPSLAVNKMHIVRLIDTNAD